MPTATGERQDRSGARIGGRFLLIERVAEESRATLYRAEALPDRRPCALRLVDPVLPPGELAAALAAVDALRRGVWDHQAPIEAVIRDGGDLAIVGPWVDGESLAATMRAVGPFSWELARELVWALGAGVAELHAAGLAFGGLAPARCLLAHEPEGVVVRLTGVGLAENRAPDEVAWMAPEQCEGGSVDPRVDVYALAAILYAMVAGEPPFVGDPAQVAMMHRFKPPRPLRSVRPGHGLPAAVEAVLLRGLEKDPARRFPGIAAMLAGLAVAESSPAAAASGGEATLVVPLGGGAGEATVQVRPLGGGAPVLRDVLAAAPGAPSPRASAVEGRAPAQVPRPSADAPAEKTAVLGILPLPRREVVAALELPRDVPEATALVPGFGGAVLDASVEAARIGRSAGAGEGSALPNSAAGAGAALPVSAARERASAPGLARSIQAIEALPRRLQERWRRLTTPWSRLRALPARILAPLLALRGRVGRLWARRGGGLGV